MSRRAKNIVIYAALFATGVFFIFPFYWVLSSSVKSRESISMVPPSFYPAEVKKDSFTLHPDAGIIAYDGSEWLKLLNSDNVLEDGEQKGAYYVRLDEGEPSQFVQYIPDTLGQPVRSNQESIAFTNVPVYRLTGNDKEILCAARMIRKVNDRVEELLFIYEKGKGNTFSLAINPEYEEIRRFHAEFSNYTETLRGPEARYGEVSTGFGTYLGNSFLISILAVIGQVFAGSFAAYGFSRLRFKGRDQLFILLLATLMVPAQVTLVPLFSIYKTIGWIDTFLPLIVPHFTASAFNIFLLRQYMLTLPRELDESAAIDGCGIFRTYFSIILPNCIPALIVVGLFTFVATWQDVMGPLIYLDSPELRTVPLGLEYFRTPYVDNRHLLMTGAVISMFPIAVLFIAFQRYIMSGIATTGLKG